MLKNTIRREASQWMYGPSRAPRVNGPLGTYRPPVSALGRMNSRKEDVVRMMNDLSRSDPPDYCHSGREKAYPAKSLNATLLPSVIAPNAVARIAPRVSASGAERGSELTISDGRGNRTAACFVDRGEKG